MPVAPAEEETVNRGMRWLPLCLMVALAACASNPTLATYRPKGPEESLIVGTLQRIPAGINAKSVDTLLLAYADDVYVGNFNKFLGVASLSSPPTLRGKGELRQVYRGLFGAAGVKDVSMDVRDFQLVVNGDRAVAQARIEHSLRIEAGRKEAKEEVLRNDVVWRLRRTPGGWKIFEEIFQ